jgi:hypothetical protein
VPAENPDLNSEIISMMERSCKGFVSDVADKIRSRKGWVAAIQGFTMHTQHGF